MTAPLHPPSLFAWEVEVVNYGDGMARVHCVHCGQPEPCVDAILLHMATDTHHWICRSTGHCHYAQRPVAELPQP